MSVQILHMGVADAGWRIEISSRAGTGTCRATVVASSRGKRIHERPRIKCRKRVRY